MAAPVRTAAGVLLLAGVAVAALQACRAEARHASLERRQGSSSGKRILLDEAHHNLFAAAASGYRSFVRLVTEDGIGDHPIMNGRDRSERIDTVSTTTGESIAGPPGSVALLPLSPTALDWVPSVAAPDERRPDQPRDFNPCPGCATRSAAGRSQGIAFELERGRVVVVGEMGVLNDYAAKTSNRQFALNIVRWLAREF